MQPGISYSPEHDFMAFDILVFNKDYPKWVDVIDIPKYLEKDVKSVPVYSKGTFDEVFGVNINIDSTIPELLGLPKLEKNLIEGMVVRPNSNLRNANGDRLIIKKKNETFMETNIGKEPKEKKVKEEKPLDPAIAPFVEELDKYTNENRGESCISKMPDEKDRNKLKTEIIKDIMTDAGKDEYKAPENADVAKKVDAEVSKRVMKALNDYYKKK